MITNFIVYNNETGEILRTGACPESMVKIQIIKDNENIIEGIANDICDQIDVKTKKIMKNYRTTPEEIAQKIIDSEPERERESLIRARMNQIVRRMAINELKQEEY